MNKESDPRRLHAKAIKTNKIYFFNRLITLYSNSNLRSSVLHLFRSIPSPNAVTWTSIISAFSTSPLAITLFLDMLRHPVKTLPRAHTVATLLKTCTSLGHNNLGPQLHALSVKLSLDDNQFIGSAFVSLYCKTEDLVSATKVFDEMPEPNEVCFAALINGLAQNNRHIEALRYFLEMRRRDVVTTCHSVSGALRAASSSAMLEQCMIIHAHALVTGLDLDVYVGTALIDGYGKCGLPEEARAVFDGFQMGADLATWNAVMAAYAQQGNEGSVVELFRLMEKRGIEPDEYSFLAVLTAFYNAGMVMETETWLNDMRMKYGVKPRIQHYTCLVGAMGRAGRLEEAEKLALTMPYEPDIAVWRALLSSCASHGKVDMCWKMSEKMLEIAPKDDSAFVILANAFAGAGKWKEYIKVWKMMRDKGVRKEAGRSWIEVRGDVHVFFAGDRWHARMNEIYEKLAELRAAILKLGYVPPIGDEMLEHEVEKHKRDMLWHHSEKLAVAFGLLSGVTPPGKPLRIIKNLRICIDCHQAFKFISIAAQKEIIVRDVNRYHKFLNGSCSCCDSW